MEDERLERLFAATAGVGPRGDFASRVMGGLPRGGVLVALPRAARIAVPVAVLAAAAAVVWAVVATRDVDDASLSGSNVLSDLSSEGE